MAILWGLVGGLLILAVVAVIAIGVYALMTAWVSSDEQQ
jgi:hypothetical protein